MAKALTATELKQRMAKELESPTQCLTCKVIASLEPDARAVVESWFDDEDMAGSKIARSLGVGPGSARHHRNNCRG